LITTNIHPDYLKGEYGESTLRLLYQQSLAEQFVGVDVRPQINARLKTEVLSGEIRPIV
jgi:hypothetical protein